MNKAIFIAILAGGKGCDGTMEELLQQNQTTQFVRLQTTGTRNILFTSACQCLKKSTNLTLAHKLGAAHRRGALPPQLSSGPLGGQELAFD